MFDLVSTGVSDEVATNLTQVLSAELERAEGASVIGRDDIKAMLTLEAEKQMLGCSDDSSCMAEIGAALGVDYIVAGHVGKVAETYMVSLRLIAPDSVQVKNRVTESFVGSEEQLVGAVRHAARRLIGVGVESGALALDTNEGDGVVLLDGREIEDLSLIPDLSPGRHSLRISKEDYLEWNSDVYVHPGEPTALTVELESRPRRWYQSWLFWTSVVAVAAGGAATAYFLTRPDDPAGSGLPQTYPFGVEVALPER